MGRPNIHRVVAGVAELSLSNGSFLGAAGTPEPAHQSEPIGIPFRNFVGVLRRWAWLVMLTVAVGVGCMTAFLVRTPPEYRSEASVLIEPRRTQVSDLQAISSESDATNMMRSQIDIIKSPYIARKVVEDLALFDRPEFQPRPAFYAPLIAAVQRIAGMPVPDLPAQTEHQRLEATFPLVLSVIGLQNEVRSNVLRIWAQTPDPQLSADIVNAFARQFLEFKRRQKYAAMERAHTWFSDRLVELAAKTRESERAVEAYRQQHDLAEVSGLGRGGPTVNRQTLDEVIRHSAVVIAERYRKEAQLAQARSSLAAQGRMDALPEVLNSPIVQRLRDQEALVAAREAEISAALGDRSPDVIAIRSQRRGIERRLREEMTNATAGLANEVAAARAQETALAGRLQALRAAVSADNATEVRLQGLLSEAQANRQIYDSFLVRATQLANVAGIQEPDAELVSRATAAGGPAYPRKGRLLAIAFALSFVLGVVLACVVERMRAGFATPEEMEAQLGLPVIGLVPRVRRMARDAVPAGSGGADFALALGRLRGVLQVMDRASRPRVVTVTSALPQEGKSVLAAALARNAARAGWRVLLIDCDMRHPAVAAAFRMRPEPGLAQLLAGGAPIDVAQLVRRDTSRLHVIPTGVARDDPQELLASPALTALLGAARGTYDLVVIDAPPVLPTVDALLLAQAADAVLLAVRWEKTSRAAVRDALSLLHGSGAQLLGAVMTQVQLKRFARSRAGGLAHVYRSAKGYYQGNVTGPA